MRIGNEARAHESEANAHKAQEEELLERPLHVPRAAADQLGDGGEPAAERAARDAVLYVLRAAAVQVRGARQLAEGGHGRPVLRNRSTPSLN